MYSSFFLLIMTLFLSCNGESNQEETIKVKSGNTFEIKLDAQIGTGYSWQLLEELDQNYLELIDSQYEHSKDGKDGRMEFERWTFKALKKGEAKLLFFYNPSWQKEKAKDSKFRTIKIIIE
jgi:predicted secreted protein